ncbi:hypothetical protein K440DRAFT_619316 [Wilcoxina mikolae CBS 423.85]|nr:hypothetical protein K440DRAFT_619316 [Wilcoxina mikolae CBS 423.85]
MKSERERPSAYCSTATPVLEEHWSNSLTAPLPTSTAPATRSVSATPSDGECEQIIPASRSIVERMPVDKPSITPPHPSINEGCTQTSTQSCPRIHWDDDIPPFILSRLQQLNRTEIADLTSFCSLISGFNQDLRDVGQEIICDSELTGVVERFIKARDKELALEEREMRIDDKEEQLFEREERLLEREAEVARLLKQLKSGQALTLSLAKKKKRKLDGTGAQEKGSAPTGTWTDCLR